MKNGGPKASVCMCIETRTEFRSEESNKDLDMILVREDYKSGLWAKKESIYSFSSEASLCIDYVRL